MGQYYLRPDDVDRFATDLPETRPGIAPKTKGPGAPLEVRIGINPAEQFAVKAPPELKALAHDGGRAMRGVISAGWASIAVGYQSRLNDKSEEGFCQICHTVPPVSPYARRNRPAPSHHNGPRVARSKGLSAVNGSRLTARLSPSLTSPWV